MVYIQHDVPSRPNKHLLSNYCDVNSENWCAMTVKNTPINVCVHGQVVGCNLLMCEIFGSSALRAHSHYRLMG